MVRAITPFLMALLLAGCAAQPPAPSSALLPDAKHSGWLAEQAADQLARLYPPATTRFALQPQSGDPFGPALESALRAHGYALATQAAAAAPGRPQDGAESLPLAYVLDQPLDAATYRLTLDVNRARLSRLYQLHGDGMAPAGAWTRKE